MPSLNASGFPPVHFFTGFDKSELLEQLLDARIKITRVVIPAAGRWTPHTHAVSRLAQQFGIETARVSTLNWSAVANTPVDDTILLSARFPVKIPRFVYGRYLHAVNIHPTLLPKYRGRYLEPVLIAGETESGVTLHLLDDDYDTGAIVNQIRYSVGKFDTVHTLFRKAAALELSLIMDGFRRLLDPAFTPVVQDDLISSSFFEKRTPDDSFIPNTASLLDALNVVRASNSETHPAFTVIDGQKVIVQMWRLEKPSSDFDCI